MLGGVCKIVNQISEYLKLLQQAFFMVSLAKNVFTKSRFAEHPENRDAEQKSGLAEEASQPAPTQYE